MSRFADRTPIAVMTFPTTGGRWHLAVRFGRMSHWDAKIDLSPEAPEDEVRARVEQFLLATWPDLDVGSGSWEPSIDGRGYYLKL